MLAGKQVVLKPRGTHLVPVNGCVCVCVCVCVCEHEKEIDRRSKLHVTVT